MFRSWRKKDRPQTPRSVSEAHVSKYKAPDALSSPPTVVPSYHQNSISGVAPGHSHVDDMDDPFALIPPPAVRSPRQSAARRPPNRQPLEQPRRPARPPSLDLDWNDADIRHQNGSIAMPSSSSSSSSMRSPVRAIHRVPQLDHVWEGFIRDAAEEETREDPFPSQRRLAAASHAGGRPSLHYTKSTPYLASGPALDLDSDSEASTDESGQSERRTLALFPSPPPLRVRRRGTPKPLVLHPTPSIAPLPPSPLLSSGDSTPVATPTTPRSFIDAASYPARQSYSPSRLSPLPRDPSTPPTTSLRLRTAQSVPHLAPLNAITHRNASSDIAATQKTPAVLRPAGRPQPQLSPAPPSQPSVNVHWGYAV